MKKIIKLLAFSFVAMALFAFSGTAQAAFNDGNPGADCSVAGIAIAGQPLQNGCANYQNDVAASYGQVIDVNLYYRNTSQADAQNARGTIAVKGGSFGYSFTNSISSSVGGAGPKTVTLTLPSDAEIAFNGAKVFQRRNAGPSNQTLMKSITNVNELSSFALGNGGTVESYTKCSTSGDAYCYQGYVVATFTIVKKTTVYTPKCTDPNALNYGANADCIYPQQPVCNDPNALNYGQQGVCIPRPAQQQCYVSLYASPTFISAGQPTTLSWTSNNCSSVTIYPNIGSVAVNSAGSRIDYPASSTNYTITGYGVNTATANAIVTVGQVTRPVCSDNIDNDGDGKVDAGDPGCFDGNFYNASKMSEYNVDTPVNQGSTASTMSATEITNNSCKLNGIVRINTPGSTNAYFKYGTSPSNLLYTTKQEVVGTNTGNYQFGDYIQSLAPSTTYYYKLVATNGYGTKEGELRGCTTKSNNVVVTTTRPSTTRTVVRPIVTTVPAERIVANSAPSLLFLRIDDRREDLTCSDVVDYQVVYKNVSNVVLDRAVLEVQLPAGVKYVKSSGGGTFSETTNTVTFNIGTINPNQEDAKFIQADVDCSLVDSDMLVANASMSYTNPTTTAQEEAVAYDLDKFISGADAKNGRTSLTGAAIFGGGFLPNSLLGWLVLILVILGLAYLIRLFLMPVSSKKTSTTTTIHSYDDHDQAAHH